MELSEGNSAKYTLRTKSILKRIESERSRHSNSKKKENKEKEKPPPLSKYRRKTANARERNRMKEINDAFVSLQSSLPDIPGSDADKLTKITVLKLAVNYINALARVLDNNSPCMDVEDIRQIWCDDNAHMTKSDNCIKSLAKVSPIKKDDIIISPQIKSIPMNRNLSSIPKKKCNLNSSVKADMLKDKYLHTIKPTTKKSGKSRSRGKVCRTNSVATNNGAYITLKNCAMQTTHNSKSRIINNQPLMMSMTVKRTRMEPIVGHRSIKMRKYEPLLSYSTADLAQFNTLSQRLQNPNISVAPVNTISNQILSNRSNEPVYESKPVHPITPPQYHFLPLQNISPDKSYSYSQMTPNVNQYNVDIKTCYSPIPASYSTMPSTVRPIEKFHYHQPVADNMQYLSVQTSADCFSVGGPTFQDLDSPPVRNDVLLEFPRETKLSSSSDSAFSSGESAPSSPTLSLHSHSPPLDDLSPFSSLTSLSGGSTSGCSISSTDCDSVFNSLLDCEPFQEELDHFTSTFNDASSSFNLFIDQTSAAFVNCDVDA